MERIRLSGMPTGEAKTIENYYPEQPGEIMDNPFIMEALNSDGFTKLLYYPQRYEKTISDEFGTRNVPVELATTLMVEIKDKSDGRKKWKTIGHVYGVSDSKLEELGFKKWEKSDYDYEVPNSKIEISVLDDKTFTVLNLWMVEQGLRPIDNQKSPLVLEGIRV